MSISVPPSRRAADLASREHVADSSLSLVGREWRHPLLAEAQLDERPRSLALTQKPCGHCGGSGILRVDVQSHRTCMHCLGGGQLLLTSTDLLRRAGLRAVGSSSAAG